MSKVKIAIGSIVLLVIIAIIALVLTISTQKAEGVTARVTSQEHGECKLGLTQ